MIEDDDTEDILGGEDAPAATPKKAKRVKKDADPKRPSKAKVTKTAPKEEVAPKKAAKKTAAVPAKKAAKKSATNGDATPRGRPKIRDDDVSTIQPEDSAVLKAVRKLKTPTLAAEFAANLEVHRRVIRAQLQRLAKDKANGIKMVKDGYNWYVSNTQKSA